MKFEGHLYEANKAVQQHLSDLMNRNNPPQYVKVEISEPRNYEFHKKFFAMCKVVSLHERINIDVVRSEIAIKLGHHHEPTKWKIDNVEYWHFVAKSISFAQMSEDDFKEFYENAKLVVCEIWDFDKEALEELIRF